MKTKSWVLLGLAILAVSIPLTWLSMTDSLSKTPWGWIALAVNIGGSISLLVTYREKPFKSHATSHREGESNL